MKKKQFLIFITIIVIGIILHLVNITEPKKPVFDEVYFVTFAASYVKGQPPILDIHPPLGKLIYSVPLWFSRSSLSNENSVFLINEKIGDKIKMHKPVFKPFYDFPYLTLRLISSFFGVLLIIAVYLFVKNLTQNETAAFLAMFLITFENALLLQTRFILLDGMYLAFGFLALAFFFLKKPKPILAGIIFGLALSVKLIAIVFIGPIIFYFLLSDSQKRKELKKQILLFFSAGVIIFLIVIVFANAFLIPVSERLKEYNLFFDNLLLKPKETFPNYPIFYQKLVPYFQAFFIEIATMITGYVYIDGSHPFSSSWHSWFLMQKPIVYSYADNFVLIGNIFVWFLGLIAIVYAIFKKQHLVLLGSYIFALVPFMLVQRPTFLYHYFPALIFAISLAAVIISERIALLTSKERKRFLLFIGGIVILFFVIASPFTFGFRFIE